MSTPARRSRSSGSDPVRPSSSPAARRERGRLARWDPFSEFRRLEQQMNQLMQSWPNLVWSGDDEFAPLGDIEETDDAYVIEVEVPGVAKEDIDVEVSGRRLVVSGERKEKDRTGILRHRTRAVGRFRYEVVLPGEIDEKEMKASLADGELVIRVSKAAAERPRHIKVN